MAGSPWVRSRGAAALHTLIGGDFVLGREVDELDVQYATLYGLEKAAGDDIVATARDTHPNTGALP